MANVSAPVLEANLLTITIAEVVPMIAYSARMNINVLLVAMVRS